LQQLNASGPDVDYLATYDPQTGVVARLEPSFPGLMTHGLDVVPSHSNPAELFIYAVNHRKPADRQSAPKVGADSTIEIFKTTVGSTTLKHLRTLRDPVIIAPNDIVGSPDGESFFFTNDHNSRTSKVCYVLLPCMNDIQARGRYGCCNRWDCHTVLWATATSNQVLASDNSHSLLIRFSRL
jgi:hypothetical protein